MNRTTPANRAIAAVDTIDLMQAARVAFFQPLRLHNAPCRVWLSGHSLGQLRASKRRYLNRGALLAVVVHRMLPVRRRSNDQDARLLRAHRARSHQHRLLLSGLVPPTRCRGAGCLSAASTSMRSMHDRSGNVRRRPGSACNAVHAAAAMVMSRSGSVYKG
jgi:hypothetical protein